jgi:hypothetical protein
MRDEQFTVKCMKCGKALVHLKKLLACTCLAGVMVANAATFPLHQTDRPPPVAIHYQMHGLLPSPEPPHTEQERDTRQPQKPLATSGSTASVATFTSPLIAKQAAGGFHAEFVNRAGDVTVLQFDANGIRIIDPQR